VLAHLDDSDDEGYFAAATQAEALLLLGDVVAAHSALERGAALHGDDYGAVATTRRQLRLICEHAGIDASFLAVLAGPRVVHYCGHRITRNDTGPFRAEDQDAAARAIAAELDRRPAAYAYGSLASGADIFWAEALVERGTELHVVLPFGREEFVAASVADAGPEWVARFDRCFSAAARVTFATDDAFLDDDVLYRYGSELAMGLALLRARFVDGEARQLALWDGLPARGAAGTAIDVEAWGGHGREATIVAPPRRTPEAARAEAPYVSRNGRIVRAMLFADVKGFSKLGDAQLPRFAEHVLGAFANALGRHRDSVEFSNTWGDGLYVVMTDAITAAACALDLQHAMSELDLVALGLPGHERIQAHAQLLRNPRRHFQTLRPIHLDRRHRQKQRPRKIAAPAKAGLRDGFLGNEIGKTLR